MIILIPEPWLPGTIHVDPETRERARWDGVYLWCAMRAFGRVWGAA